MVIFEWLDYDSPLPWRIHEIGIFAYIELMCYGKLVVYIYQSHGFYGIVWFDIDN